MPVSKWPRLVEILEPNHVTAGGDEQLVVFSEYADTAEWLTERFRDAGYTAEMYSGRQTHPEREAIRARFVAGDFQVFVSTDAGNEGIDLQSARVLVNWDVPWSLVTLEQRLGRIHRVGQTRDVDLYNLIALETREGDAHATLLNNLVAAANELDGKMFDSLALVGELLLSEAAGVESLETFLAELHQPGGDPDAATTAIAAMTKERIRQIHGTLRRENQALASKVDVGRAIVGINQQRLDRINPHVVERYLSRLDDAQLIQLSRSTVADTGLWHVKPDRLAPLPFSPADGALIATSGDAKRAAVRDGATSAEHAIPLGPIDEAFRALVTAASDQLEPDLYQGGGLHDPTAVTDYQLYCFTAAVHQGRTPTHLDVWRHTTHWSYLVKVDATGTRIVPWETLANLEAPAEATPRTQHPADTTNAETQARQAANRDATDRRADLDDWLTQARTQLLKLPNDLTDDIADTDERTTARLHINEAIKERTATLEAAAEFAVGAIELVGWAHIAATAAPDSDDEDANSEIVSMQHVTQLLRNDGWAVSDVHTERVGYDLKATRGSAFRAVEVKGLKGSASSSGIVVTGAELATAGMHGSDYWLYVVDHCVDGTGQLYAAWPDPATVFAGATKDIPVLRINGSDLAAAKERSA